MYEAAADPYCYAGTSVLKNIPGIREQTALDAFEAISTAQRSDEPLPRGRLSVTHYRAIHSHFFQDIYAWAGRFRTVRVSKGGSTFCYPENIAREMTILFSDLRLKRHLRGLPHDDFSAGAARFLATLIAIHPFRDGNGRTQLSFLALLAARAGHPLELGRLVPDRFLVAIIASFRGDEGLLATEIRNITV